MEEELAGARRRMAIMSRALSLDRKGRLRVPEEGRGGVTESIIELLQAHQWTVVDLRKVGLFITPWGSKVKVGQKGQPDLLALRHQFITQVPGSIHSNTAVLFIECKSRDGRISTDQQRVHGDLRKRGFTVIVARGPEDLKEWL